MKFRWCVVLENVVVFKICLLDCNRDRCIGLALMLLFNLIVVFLVVGLGKILVFIIEVGIDVVFDGVFSDKWNI